MDKTSQSEMYEAAMKMDLADYKNLDRIQKLCKSSDSLPICIVVGVKAASELLDELCLYTKQKLNKSNFPVNGTMVLGLPFYVDTKKTVFKCSILRELDKTISINLEDTHE